MIEGPAFFQTPRINSDISAEEFNRQFFQPEIPVIIEGSGLEWAAIKKWNPAYLRDRLSGKPGVNSVGLFLSLDSDILADDFTHPAFIKSLVDSPDIFPYKSNARIWTNTRNNISAWHYDNGVVNNFNAQIVGRKEWILISPKTPPDCYPFSNFVIPESDEKILTNKIYTRCITKPGDILYLPPLWYHTVKSLDEVNINLMWVYTKRKSLITTPALIRDERRYRMHKYLSTHRLAVVRKMYSKLTSSMPAHLRIQWHYDQLIETGITHTPKSLMVWYLKEWSMIGKSILTMPKWLKQFKDADRAIKLD